MFDRAFSFDDINISTLKIQLDETREELRQISSKLDENDPPDSFIALLNYETELSGIIKDLEDSSSSHIKNNSNVNDTKNSIIGKSQVEQDYEIAFLLSEQIKLEDARLWSPTRAVENLDSISPLIFSHGDLTEEIDRSMENWSFSNLNTPARHFNHHSDDITAKDSQVQFDYEIAVLLSKRMQLEDTHLRSLWREAENFHDAASSSVKYGYGADIKAVERSIKNWRLSNINNPEEISRNYISRNFNIAKSQVQRDCKMALELSGEFFRSGISKDFKVISDNRNADFLVPLSEELKQKDLSLRTSGKSLNNFCSNTPISTEHGLQSKCTGCYDLFIQSELISVGCPEDHFYCKNCLRKMFQFAISKEVPFPPRCCGKPIAFPSVAKHFSPTETKQYLDAELEHQTKDKIYCYRLECGQFIPRGGSDGDKATCPRCQHKTCLRCKKAAHRGDCEADEDMQRLKALADQNKWVRCFQCQSIVDRIEGCNHMTCRCGAQFCYKCSRRWKTCSCEEIQFDLIQNFQPFHNQNLQHPPIQDLQYHPVHDFQESQNPHYQDFFQNWNLNNLHRF